MNMISLPPDHHLFQRHWVSGLDGSRLPARASVFLAEEDAEEAAEARFLELAVLRDILVRACGGEAAYERLVAQVDESDPSRAVAGEGGVSPSATLRRQQRRDEAIVRSRAVRAARRIAGKVGLPAEDAGRAAG